MPAGSPLPTSETHVFPNAHSSVQSHRPLPSNTEIWENWGETLERTLERNVVALRSHGLTKEMAPQVGLESTLKCNFNEMQVSG